MTIGRLQARAGALADGHADRPHDRHGDPLRRLVEFLPRPLRFLAVGGLGLLTDIGSFSLIVALWPHPLLARIVSLALATLVTWRLNRALTFEHSGRRAHHEAARYLAVTLLAQGVSYATFAVLVITRLAHPPQLALIAGAVLAAVVSYNGHRLFAFAPSTGRAPASPK